MKNLGFGFMRLPLLDKDDPKSFDVEQIKEMVDTYLENGFKYFDTAYFYHAHESERILKKVLVDRHKRDSFLVATKLPTSALEEKDDMERVFNEQLEKVGVEYFDYYLLHCLNREMYEKMERFNGFEFALQKKKEGKIKKFGFSFHDTADVLDKILSEHPEVEFVQLQINYLDWDDENVQSKKCHEVAVKHGKEIIVMEPVKGGALATVPENAKEMFLKQNPKMTVPSWAIRFSASLENVFMVLSGMSDMRQVLDNISYMDDFVPLNEKEVATCFEVAKIIKKLKAVSCTACRYCTEVCPNNIPIPEYFGTYNKYIENRRENAETMKAEYERLSGNIASIKSCLGCKMCEKHCPQHIEIVDSLKRVKETFEGTI